MTRADTGKTVKVSFVGTLEDGVIFGEATEERPLTFKIGEPGVISGLANAVCGMEPGQRNRVSISPAEGFGEYDTSKVLTVDREAMEGDKPEVGEKVKVHKATGEKLDGRIESFSDKSVVVNCNHPLAGKQLDVEFKVLDVA